jgi:hypothetical protein
MSSNTAVALFLGSFLLMWVSFALWSFRRRWSWTITIGGGFCVAAVGMIVLTYPFAFVGYLREHSKQFSFAVDQLEFLSFWLVADLVLFIVYPRLIATLAKIPLIGSICSYLIFMPIFHASALVYGIFIGFGATETHAYMGAGVFVLIVIFRLAYWVAADNVRTGNIGMR